MNEIKVSESSVDEQRFRAVLDQDQMLGLVAAAVANMVGVDLGAGNVAIRMLHITTSGGGLNTTKYGAVCEIVVDRLPRAAEGTA
ncbi:hypothetical protein [Cupriavidus sp. UBA2534]|uniref:hypothetical protein n=1 Tax=Cupriavidus sp. UBA2534 TaxID=1946399 RepID=UPI00257FCA66|nr:hypothetical protein [Cupriavidus sp. UBA2534]